MEGISEKGTGREVGQRERGAGGMAHGWAAYARVKECVHKFREMKYR